MGSTVALVGGTVVDGTGRQPVDDATVLVVEGRIAGVGPREQIPVPDNATVIDATGKTVMPALADMHVHLTGGWDGESSDTLGYHRYLKGLLYAGVTTVFDVGNIFPDVLQLRQEVNAGRIAGPRMYIVGPLLDGPDPFWFPLTRVITSVSQIPGIVAALHAAGVDALKAYAELSAVHIAALVREGAKYGLPVILDAWQVNGSLEMMSQTGIKAWGHLKTTAVMDQQEIDFMAEHQIRQLTTLAVFESFSLRRLRDLSFLRHPIIADTTPPYVFEELAAHASASLANPSDKQKASQRRLEVALANAKALHDRGVMLVAGTDAPYPGVFQGEGIHRELELLVEAGLTPVEAIACATGNAAKHAGAEHEWGTIECGCAADIVVVAGQPARRVSDTRQIELVLQRGRPLDRERLKYDPAREIDFRPVRAIT